MKSLYRYIIKEFTPSYLLGFTFFSIFLLIQLLFQIVSLYIEKSVPLPDVLELLLYGTAWVVSFSIPIGVLMGTVLSLGRINGDSEVIAMRANGISLLSIFKPIVFMGFLIMSFNIFYYEVIYPWGMTKYYEKYTNLGIKDPTTQLSENFLYDDPSSDYVIQVDAVDRDTRELINVKITSTSDNKLIIAERGKFLEFDEKREIFPLELFNTLTQPLNPDKGNEMGDSSFYEMRSNKMTLNIEFKLPNSEFRGNTSSWSISELYRNMIKKEVEYSLRMINIVNKQSVLLKEIYETGAVVNYPPENRQNLTLNFDNVNLTEEAMTNVEQKFNTLRKESVNFSSSYENSDENINARYILEFNKKLSYSFSCLVFALLGAPLSIFSARSGKSYGLGISLVFISVWYGAHFVSERMLGSLQPIELLGLVINLQSPILRAWLPPVILLPVATYLWYNKLKS